MYYTLRLGRESNPQTPEQEITGSPKTSSNELVDLFVLLILKTSR